MNYYDLIDVKFIEHEASLGFASAHKIEYLDISHPS